MKLDFCAICGSKFELQHHHLIPKVRGGTDDETNILTLCYEHHCWFHKVKPSKFTEQSKLIKEGLRKAALRGVRPGRKSNYAVACAIHQLRNLPFRKPLPFRRMGDVLFCAGYSAFSYRTNEKVPFKEAFINNIHKRYSALDPAWVDDEEMLLGLVEDLYPEWFSKNYITAA